MMKKSLALILALVLVFSASMVAFADDPLPGGTVNIDTINNLYLTPSQLSEGYTQMITGYVGFHVPSDNQGRLATLKLEVEKNLSNLLEESDYKSYDPPLNSIVLTDRSSVTESVTGREFNLKWKITSIGSYQIRVTATFTGRNADAIDEESVVVYYYSSTVDVEFPAAPAIAARILEANNVSTRYGSSKLGGNYISDVARLMDKTEFMGEPKHDWNDDMKVMNKDYWDKVWEYLKGRDLILPNAPDGYIW